MSTNKTDSKKDQSEFLGLKEYILTVNNSVFGILISSVLFQHYHFVLITQKQNNNLAIPLP